MLDPLIETGIWFRVGRENPMLVGGMDEIRPLVLLAREDEEETTRLGGYIELGHQLKEVRVVLA